MTELIPCTGELERLKCAFRNARLQSEARRRLRGMQRQEIFDQAGRPPYTEEELMNTPWTGRYG